MMYAAKKQTYDDDDEVEREGHHYADALPQEAMMMSSTGTARGYEHLRFGARWNEEGLDPGRPVAQIDKDGVQLLVLSDDQRTWLNQVKDDPKRTEVRRTVLLRRNYCRWEDLSQDNHEYLLSLHWVPSDPLSAMEIIARMTAAP